jgi:hypothetical protein
MTMGPQSGFGTCQILIMIEVCTVDVVSVCVLTANLLPCRPALTMQFLVLKRCSESESRASP